MAKQDYIRTIKIALVAWVTLVALLLAPSAKSFGPMSSVDQPSHEASQSPVSSDDEDRPEECFLMAQVQIVHTVSLSLPIIKALCPSYQVLELPVFSLLGISFPESTPYLRYFKIVALFFVAPNAP